MPTPCKNYLVNLICMEILHSHCKLNNETSRPSMHQDMLVNLCIKNTFCYIVQWLLSEYTNLYQFF